MMLTVEAREELKVLAASLINQGLRLLPVGNDKRPAYRLLPLNPTSQKRSWSILTEVPTTIDQVNAWLGTSSVGGLAVATGQKSNYLYIFDVDEPEHLAKWIDAGAGEFFNSVKPPTQLTGGGGYQLLVKVDWGPDDGRFPGSKKLAWVKNPAEKITGRSIAIETRGEGGYAVLPHSIHPSGATYTPLQMFGADWDNIPTITKHELDRLFEQAAATCEAPFTLVQERNSAKASNDLARAKARMMNTSRKPMAGDTASVIDAYNKLTSIRDALLSAGYTDVSADRMARPGSKKRGPSVHIRESLNMSIHYSTSDCLADGKAKTPFNVFCYYEHSDDVKAAVKAAAEILGMRGNSTTVKRRNLPPMGEYPPLDEYPPMGEYPPMNEPPMNEPPPMGEAPPMNEAPPMGEVPRGSKHSPLVEDLILLITANDGDDQSIMIEMIDAASTLLAKDLTRLCKAMREKGVRKSDISRFRSDVAETKREMKLQEKLKKSTPITGAQMINGRLVHHGHATMSDLFDLGYDFRMNQLDDSVEVNGTRVTDGLMAKIATGMDDLGHTSRAKVEQTYLAYAYDNQYHPIKEYLEGLEWDGADHISELAKHFTCSVPETCAKYLDENGMFVNSDGEEYTWGHAAIRRWMCGAVAKVYGASQNPMLVIDGPQGIGKSYFCQWLAKETEQYFVEASLDTGDKDTHVRIASNWIWEVPELGATTRKADREALKSILTTAKITVRKAYARTDMEKPALASFIGTINNEGGFLADPTGNRRFMIIRVEALDHAYSSLNLNKLWAQAYALFRVGELGRLSNAERMIQNVVNESYLAQSSTDHFLEEMYEVVGDERKKLKTDKAPITEVLRVLNAAGFKGNSAQSKRELSRWVAQHGIKKISRARFYGQRRTCYDGLRYLGNRCDQCGSPEVLTPLTFGGVNRELCCSPCGGV